MVVLSVIELILYVNEIKQTMDCEGLPLTAQNENDIADILSGKHTVQEVKDEILKRHGFQ